MSRLRTLALAAALFALGAPGARADFTPSLAGTSSTATTTSFTYTLSFTPTAYQGTATLVSGNFITLYDLYASPSTLASSSAPASIGVSQAFVGVTPPGFNPPVPDDPGLENLTFTYTGPNLTASTNFSVTFTLNGQFTTHSGLYTSITQYNANSGGTGTTATEAFATLPLAVPEPGSWALVGVGGALVLASRRRRAAGDRAR